jgi:hypothetical protein
MYIIDQVYQLFNYFYARARKKYKNNKSMTSEKQNK